MVEKHLKRKRKLKVALHWKFLSLQSIKFPMGPTHCFTELSCVGAELLIWWFFVYNVTTRYLLEIALSHFLFSSQSQLHPTHKNIISKIVSFKLITSNIWKKLPHTQSNLIIPDWRNLSLIWYQLFAHFSSFKKYAFWQWL